MSLTLSNQNTANFEPLEEGTYAAVCFALVDLGQQYNEKWQNSSRKVLVGWEIPGETITVNGEEQPRTFYKRFTASLNEKAELRKVLKAWRGRDFTDEELAAFDLKNILGAPCLIQVIHNTVANGRTYANLAAVARLPKGYPTPVATLAPLTFDIDSDDPRKVEELPEWIRKTIQESPSWQDRIAAAQAPGFTEVPDDGEDDGQLPF